MILPQTLSEKEVATASREVLVAAYLKDGLSPETAEAYAAMVQDPPFPID